MTDPEIDGHMVTAIERLMHLRRELRTGVPKVSALLGLLALSTDLHNYVIEQTANLMKGTRR